jgi:hypothetical protein
MNKKAQSEAGLLLTLLVFQAVIIVFLGFLELTTEQNEVGTPTLNLGLFSVPKFGFNIISNIAQLGWFNLIIFVPISIVVGYIVARIIRGGG